MKYKFYTLILFLFSPFLIYCQPSWLWARSANGIDNEAGNKITSDASGNVYVTGNFSGNTVIFGGISLVSNGSNDMFVAKYNASGSIQWAKSAGGVNNDFGKGIAVDASGNVYVTGYFSSPSIMFGSTTLTKAGINDIFIVKYDMNGNIVWAKGAGGSGDDYSYAIAADAAGNAFITGSFQSSSISFGAFSLTNTDSNSSFSDIFLVKYNAAGNVLFAKAAGGYQEDVGRGIALDKNDNALITGTFAGSLTFPGSVTLSNSGQLEDILVAKYDSSGTFIWAKSATGKNTDRANSITVDAKGNAIISGFHNSSKLFFGTVAVQNTDTNTNNPDIFIAKYDASGNLLWAKGAGGSSSDYSDDIASDGSGNSYITGTFLSNSISFGSTTLTSTTSGDIFIARYDSLGNATWAIRAGGNQLDQGNGINIDGFGNIILTGFFSSDTCFFGSKTLAITGIALTDFFVAKYGIGLGVSGNTINFSDIGVYPNPGNGMINISSKENMDELKILNALGQVVYQSVPNEKNIKVALIQPGVYFISITVDKQVITRKFIVE